MGTKWQVPNKKVFQSTELRLRLKKVSSEIRLFLIFVLATLALSTVNANAQTANTQGQQSDEQVFKEDAGQQNTSLANSSAQGPILRLEDTIRGNKEQPQVLTIVPWQLPVHQRINENTQWQLQVNTLPSIERSAFLRNLAVVKEIQKTQEDESPKSP